MGQVLAGAEIGLCYNFFLLPISAAQLVWGLSLWASIFPFLEAFLVRYLQRLWCDEAGFVLSTELTMVTSVLVIALATGLTAVRNHVVGEFGNVANAMGQISQSYSLSGIQGHSAATSGAGYSDAPRSVGDLTANLQPIELYDPTFLIDQSTTTAQ